MLLPGAAMAGDLPTPDGVASLFPSVFVLLPAAVPLLFCWEAAAAAAAFLALALAAWKD